MYILENFAQQVNLYVKSVTEEEMFVVDGLERALLGREAAQRLHLINRVDSITTPVTKAAMQSEYPTLFKGWAKWKVKSMTSS